MSRAMQPDGDMLSTPMCIKTVYIQTWCFITLKSYKYRPSIVQSVGTYANFILKLHSELNVFNLSGNVFQVEDPEKAKLVLNWSIRGRGKT